MAVAAALLVSACKTMLPLALTWTPDAMETALLVLLVEARLLPRKVMLPVAVKLGD